MASKHPVLDHLSLRVELTEYREKGEITLTQFTTALAALNEWANTGTNPPVRPPFWRLREHIRITHQVYSPFHLTSTAATKIFDDIPAKLYAHPAKSLNQPAMISFTKDERGGEADIQMISRVGKFLRKYCPDLSEQEINDAANEYTRMREEQRDGDLSGLQFFTDPNDIINAYRNCTTSSCMSYSANKWGLALHKDNDHLPYEMVAALEACADSSGYIHPAAIYAYMQDIAVAVYIARTRIVARTIVNRETLEYTRVYGNSHIINLLREEGYQCGQLYPTTLPIIKVYSTNHSGDCIIAPYIDGTEETVPSVKIFYGDTHGVVGDYRDGLTMRNYSGACLLYRKNISCTDCALLHRNTSELIPLYVTSEEKRIKRQLCKECYTKAIAIELQENRFGLMWTSGLGFHITEDVKDAFVPYEGDLPFSVGSITCLKNQAIPRYNENGDTLNNPSATLETLLDSNDYKVIAVAQDLLRFAQTHIHKEAATQLIIDDISGEQSFTPKMATIVMPDGSEGRTCTPLMRILSKIVNTRIGTNNNFYSYDAYTKGLYDDLFESYGTGPLVELSSKATRPTSAIPGLPGRNRGNDHRVYAPVSECIPAIVDELNNHELMPRSLCIFAAMTGKWFAVRGTASGFIDDEITIKGLEYATKKYGSQIMYANAIVDNRYPSFLISVRGYRRLNHDLVQNNKAMILERLREQQTGWVRWHEEIYASHRLTPLIPLLDEEKPTNGTVENPHQWHVPTGNSDATDTSTSF